MKGSALVAAFILIVIGSMIVGGYLSFVSREVFLTKKTIDAVKALYIAEAGLELAQRQTELDWPDNSANQLFKLNSISQTNFGGGNYEVTEAWINPNAKKKITSVGRYGGEIRTVNVEVYLDPEVNFLDQVIASSGSQGAGQIKGNVRIMGSVYIMGEEPFVDANENSLYDAGESFRDLNNSGDWGPYLTASDNAINMTGNSEIGNNYGSMPLDLKSRVPSIYDGDFSWDTLGANLMVKYGKVTLNSGSASIGAVDDPSDGLKNSMDSVVVPDGVDIIQGVMNTDEYFEGADNRDKFKDKVRMPSMKDAYTDTATGTFYPCPASPYSSDTLGGYEQFLYEVATDAVDTERGYYHEGDLTISPTSEFSYGNLTEFGKSGIAMDGDGNLTINGLIYINGKLTFDAAPGKDDIYYSGRGTFYVRGYRDSDLTNDTVINLNILTKDAYKGAFPDNVLGLMTRENIYFSGANNHVSGVFFAEDTITMSKQYEIAGTVISADFDMTDQVPSIYQVPGLANNEPPYYISVLFPSEGPMTEDWYESYQ